MSIIQYTQKNLSTTYDWESILQELRGDTHLQTTRSYRETLLAIQQAEQAGDTALADRLKERKDRLKQGQPAIT